jgi:tellurite methyltransferase
VSADPTPSSWLLSNLDLIPRAGRALDVACGRGRHALFLAGRGLTVRAVDRDAEKVAALRAEASASGLALQAEVLDLEAGEADLGRDAHQSRFLVAAR